MYWFLDEKNKILYVGKAKNLKKRINSYTKIKNLNQRIKNLIGTAVNLKFKILESELEAILIEAELIRLHQPIYNILLKDDKTPIYLLITNEVYPRIIKIRKKELRLYQNRGIILGPFASAAKLKEVLSIARKIFQWCDEAGKTNHNFKKSCFYHQIQLCGGACIKIISPKNYQQKIKNLVLFLKGKKKTVIKILNIQMKKLADELKFEQADKIKQQLQLIKVVTSKNYKLKPELILPNLSQTQNKNCLIHLYKILSTYLSLPKKYQFKRIEGYDVSNISGKNASVSMVVFTNGLPNKKEYRLFNIKSLDTPNDCRMMKEALNRRQNHPEWSYPDLILVDGGKGQVRAALTVWQKNNPIIGLAKNPDRIIIPIQTDEKGFAVNRVGLGLAHLKMQNLCNKISWQVLRLPEDHPALKLLQQVRDESHRFAKKQHIKLRQKNFLPE